MLPNSTKKFTLSEVEALTARWFFTLSHALPYAGARDKFHTYRYARGADMSAQEAERHVIAHTGSRCITLSQKEEAWFPRIEEVATADALFVTGDRIKVHGLIGKPEHNGKLGMVVGQHGTERKQVRLDDGTEMALQPQRLLWLPVMTVGESELDGPSEFACAHCKTEPPAGKKHQRCELCVTSQLTPGSYYCNGECQRADWKRHSAWHKSAARRCMQKPCLQNDLDVAEALDARAERSGNEYDALIAEGIDLDNRKKYRSAAKVYKEAMALMPWEPAAYQLLGICYAACEEVPRAAKAHLDAFKRCPPHRSDANGRTHVVFMAFNKLCMRACPEELMPPWWNDVELKLLSQRAVEDHPHWQGTWQMRGTVLQAFITRRWAGDTTPRSSQELREAARAFQRSGEIAVDASLKRDMVRRAVMCNQRAVEIENSLV